MADAEVLFAGAQGEFVGLDQCNVRLVPLLAWSGEISRSADGGRQKPPTRSKPELNDDGGPNRQRLFAEQVAYCCASA
jgi:hypothetical protein